MGTHARGVLSRKKQLDDLIVISCQVKLRRGKVIFSLLEEIKTEDPIVQGFKIQNNTYSNRKYFAFSEVDLFFNFSFLLLIWKTYFNEPRGDEHASLFWNCFNKCKAFLQEDKMLWISLHFLEWVEVWIQTGSFDTFTDDDCCM